MDRNAIEKKIGKKIKLVLKTRRVLTGFIQEIYSDCFDFKERDGNLVTVSFDAIDTADEVYDENEMGGHEHE